MSNRIGFLHAHHSNIEHVEAELRHLPVEAVHFVEPGLVHRLRTDPSFGPAAARLHVQGYLDWIAGADLAAVVVTCTNYAALLDGVTLPIPILTIDEPFFADLCAEPGPQSLLFTNPATVEGTMRRLHAHAHADGRGATLDLQVLVIGDAFALVMQGRLAEYNGKVAAAVRAAATQNERKVSVAQLSMVPAARQAAEQLGREIGHPLSALMRALRPYYS